MLGKGRRRRRRWLVGERSLTVGWYELIWSIDVMRLLWLWVKRTAGVTREERSSVWISMSESRMWKADDLLDCQWKIERDTNVVMVCFFGFGLWNEVENGLELKMDEWWRRSCRHGFMVVFVCDLTGTACESYLKKAPLILIFMLL